MDYKQRREEATGIYDTGLWRVKNNPTPSGQKFPPGSFVHIAKDLGPGMSHFRSDRPARVEYTYAHAYPDFNDKNIDSYSLMVRNDNDTWSSSAWYNEHQLTEITDEKLIEQYKKELEPTDRDTGKGET